MRSTDRSREDVIRTQVQTYRCSELVTSQAVPRFSRPPAQKAARSELAGEQMQSSTAAAVTVEG